ncbi:hypothetical protein MVEN_02013600 [Mycena venus]|uniref:HNH nuclease domain-containing protein n=1 Tax=Mycena venus TaxID=2733690 RepID=A0A8H6XBY0_9AGAR|nr:hypothetical protein MVEN_02013600 [Mycena venus]
MTYPSVPPLGQSWSLPSCSEIALDAPGASAWNLLLSAETAALTLATLPATKYQDNLVAVRLVGWFLKDLWEHDQNVAYGRFLMQVTSCNCAAAVPGDPAAGLQQRHDKIFALGLVLRNHLLRVFYSPADRTPTSSASESPPSYHQSRLDEHRALIMKRMVEIDDPGGRTHKQAKDDALLRDGYKCVMTGYYDKVTLMKIPELNAKSSSEHVPCVDTQVVHLLPVNVQSAASALAILKMFGLESMAERLLGNRVNSLFNTMTMCTQFREDFDQLLFWLEAVPGQEHIYTVVARHPETFFRQIPMPPRTVTLHVDSQAVRDYERHGIARHLLELPHPELIAIRATFARVAAMSGATDQIRLLREDKNNTETLTDSDTTVHLLASLLRTLA